MLYPQEDCIPLRSSTSGLTPGQTCLPLVVSRILQLHRNSFCVECSMSSDDAAEGFTMKTHWKGKGLAIESEKQKGKILVDVKWKFMSYCQQLKIRKMKQTVLLKIKHE